MAFKVLQCTDSDPENRLRQLGDLAIGDIIAVRFTQHRDWAPFASQDWCAVYQWNEDIECYFVGLADTVMPNASAIEIDNVSIMELAQRCNASLVYPSRAMLLQPVYIPKPWGQEIWYSGIEERGICRLGEAVQAPQLDVALTAASRSMMGAVYREPVLLKILDPHADAELGDLYFELHEHKQEVYIVTHVDESAWPHGRGAIRMGVDSERLAEYPDENAFRTAFRHAIGDYETIRRQIDDLLDKRRVEQGIGLNDAVEPVTAALWLAELPESLRSKELKAREKMNAFTRLVSLDVGDVVKVPCLIPHSLQHGVRTVEFQTPVYERKILSFNQKVLTQNYWDSAEAVTAMSLEITAEPSLPVVYEDADSHVERLVDFDDFTAYRITIQAGGAYQLSVDNFYRLLMTISDHMVLDAEELSAEQAWMLPAKWAGGVLRNTGSTVAVALVAEPR